MNGSQSACDPSPSIECRPCTVTKARALLSSETVTFDTLLVKEEYSISVGFPSSSSSGVPDCDLKTSRPFVPTVLSPARIDDTNVFPDLGKLAVTLPVLTYRLVKVYSDFKKGIVSSH